MGARHRIINPNKNVVNTRKKPKKVTNPSTIRGAMRRGAKRTGRG